MSTFFTPDIGGRQIFIDRSVSRANAFIEKRPYLQRALGASAFNFFLPEINSEGVISIPAYRKSSLGHALMPIKECEDIQRDTSFAQFTAPQRYAAEDIYYREGKPVANASIDLNRIATHMQRHSKAEARQCQTFGDAASVMRLTYGRGDPETGDLTLFNMRPLALIEYAANTDTASPALLAHTHIRAQKITENPVVTLKNIEELDTLNARWLVESYSVGGIVAQAMIEADLKLSDSDYFQLEVEEKRKEVNPPGDPYCPHPVLIDLIEHR